MTHAADEALVARARGGDLESFAAIVRTHQARIRAYIGAQVQQPALVDDLAQDVFVRAHAALKTLADWRAVRAWLYGIARNRVLEHLRDARRTRPSGGAEDLLDEARMAALTAEAQAAEAFETRIEALQRCLDGLAPHTASLVRRHYFDGESLAALATTAGKNEGTMRMTFVRVRAALRACVETRLAEGTG